MNIKSMFTPKEKKPRRGVHIAAANGKVFIKFTDGVLILTPELARQIARSLPRFASIAEQDFRAK